MSSFLLQLLIFIGFSILIVPLFQKLGFGSVLGYLIAGIVVGPFGFKLITGSEDISQISEYGVIFLLFMIGLEIQPRKLWSMRRHLLQLGGLQVLFCALVFSAICLLFGLSVQAAAVVGFSLSLSSTAFAVQTLTEKNVFNTEFGRSSFAVLLMQDLVAIPALALIPMLAAAPLTGAPGGHSAAPNGWLGLLIIAALVGASRYLIRPVFRIIANMRSRDLFTAVTLFIVLGVAGLMEIVGLSAALGTFIAGVLFSDSEYRTELEANLEPFKALLLGLFFIAVGLGVDLSLVVQKPFVVLGLTLGYLATKTAVIYFVGRLFKLNSQNAKSMAVTISQGGEFAFVILGMAFQMSLIESGVLSLLTLVITASMALSPVMSLANDKLSRALRRTTEPQFDKIDGENPEVIIAGFGRFGQIFGRILRAQGIPFVAIDHDADQIDLVRRFGSKVYYGDASRKDILESAGAASAKYIILAIDNVEMSVKAAEIIKQNYPNLKIFARARNRNHVFDLMNLKVDFVKRETFDSSVYFVKDLLLDMGFKEDLAGRIVEKFKIHDEIMMKRQFLVREDAPSMLSVSKQGVELLEQVLREENRMSNIGPAEILSPEQR
jgi:monovalent cation:proton antiporter-2 (CPA2) family protein